MDVEKYEKEELALWQQIVRFVMPAVILAAGALTVYILIKTRPHMNRKPPEKMAALVSVKTISPMSDNVIVRGMGTVVASRQVQLHPRISGEIVWVSDNFLDGEKVSAGEHLLTIDPTDYKLQVEIQRSNLAQAQADLELEEGRQAVAKREWQRLQDKFDVGEKIDNSLALRKPQLSQAKARLQAAKVALEKAELDLSRTEVTAPFDCLILSKRVDLGAQVSPQTQLAEITDTGEFWVELLLDVSKLDWIDIPEMNSDKGSPARIVSNVALGNSIVKEGAVLRLLGDLQKHGMMARVLVSVPDPMSVKDGGLPLLLGSSVHVEITGHRLDNVYKIDRNWLHDGDVIWVDNDNTLATRKIDIVWRDESVVYFNADSDKLIIVTSDLKAPINGIPLRIVEAPDE